MTVSQAELLRAKVQLTIEYHFGLACDRAKDLGDVKSEAIELLKLFFSKVYGYIQQNEMDTTVKETVDLLHEIHSRRSELLRKEIRNQGNQAIRVIHSHIDHFKIVRRHSRDTPNIQRIASHIDKEDTNGG